MKAAATLVIYTVLCTVYLSSGDRIYRGNTVTKEYPEQCLYRDLDKLIPKEQVYHTTEADGRCESIYCRSDYVLEIDICGRHNLTPNDTCKIGSDFSLSYPRCCPQLICEPTKDLFDSYNDIDDIDDIDDME